MVRSAVLRVTGIDARRSERVVARPRPGGAPHLQFELIAGGHSNLTTEWVDSNGTA